MERAVIRGMVEDLWRALIPAMQGQNAAALQEIASRFEERVNATAAALPPIEAAAYLQAVEAERESIIADYQADPAALKARLGIALGVDAGPSRGQSVAAELGAVAVRTAVRATVWDGIWALFRLGR